MIQHSHCMTSERGRAARASFSVVVATLALHLAMVALAAVAHDATFTVVAGELEGPEMLRPGYHEVTLSNDGEEGFNVIWLRLHEGANRDDVIAAVEDVDRVFAGEGDTVEAFTALLELADVYGEVTAAPGATASIGMELEPGTYLLVVSVQSDEGPQAGAPANTYRTVDVSGDHGAEPPDADQTVHMVDLAFALPGGIEAGEQTWRVVNSGQQLHHMVLLRLQEGMTMDDVMAWMESEEGPPPADEAGYVGVLSTGVSNYLTLDLTPGEYLAICFMPDHLGQASGQPHFMLGLMQNSTVGGP
jgi:hypothetical protein